MKAYLPSLRLVLSTAAVALIASVSLAVSRPATVTVDGQRLISDVSPVTSGESAYLPLRAVTEAAGAETSFDERSGEIVIRRGADTLRMRLGERAAELDGQKIELSHAPFTVHGHALIRGSDLAVALGSSVRYDKLRGRIDIRTPGAVVAGAPDDSP